MSTTKRILGDYTISTISANNRVGSGNVTINGNLLVTGNTTVIGSNSISTFDPTIQVNGNLTTTSEPYNGFSGLEVVRGIEPTVALYWNESIDKWQITTDINTPGLYTNIALAGDSSGNVATGLATQLSYYAVTGDGVSPTGANLTWTNNSNLTVTGNVSTTSLLTNETLYIKNSSSTVAGVSGNVVIAANTANQGGTGLYVNNSSVTDELVSKTKARKFAIIFG